MPARGQSKRRHRIHTAQAARRRALAGDDRALRLTLMLDGVLLLTMLVYLRCLGNGFVFDDHEMIVINRYLGQWSFLWKSLVNDSWWFRDPLHLPQSSYYRPLQDIWLGIHYQLFGLVPGGWHATMIALHLAAVWMAFKIASRLTGDLAHGDPGRGTVRPAPDSCRGGRMADRDPATVERRVGAGGVLPVCRAARCGRARYAAQMGGRDAALRGRALHA